MIGTGRRQQITYIALRCVWALAVLYAVFVLVSGYPPFVASLYTPCEDPTGQACKLLQIHQTQLPALAEYGISLHGYAFYALACDLMASIAMIGTGLLIWTRKLSDSMTMFVSLLLIVFGAFGVSDGHVNADAPLAIFVINKTFIFLKWVGVGILFCTFPDGRFVTRWSWLVIFMFAAQQSLQLFLPYPYNIDNWPAPFGAIGMLLVYGSATAAQVYRFFHASPRQRQQIKWFAFGFCVTFLFVIIARTLPALINSFNEPESIYHLTGPFVRTVAYLMFPSGIAIALLRYRLWDIDIVINRALIYAIFSLTILAIYVTVVLGLSTLLRVENSMLFSLIATVVIAILIQPLRMRVEQGVNRLMFGERNDPYRALADLGKQLEESLPAGSLLPTVVKSVAQALKLPYVAIVWNRVHAPIGEEVTEIAVTEGISKDDSANKRIPLVHQGLLVGELILSPRQRGEDLTSADLRLVRDLAPQIGVAVHSARLTADLRRLTADLQRSREHLVTAREEERRRLRRDLHDGLGPLLSSQTLMLSAVRKHLRNKPELAEQLLADAIMHTQQAIADIRRLVYALRPPVLDDLGLLAALREQIAHYNTSGIEITLDAPETLPPLPAAIEIACYRIVQEALTNVVRHAHATTAQIRLHMMEALTVEVIDNGQGLPPGMRVGVGFHSMRERAEELRGTWEFESSPGKGTRIYARIPLTITNHERIPAVLGGEGA